MKAAFRADASRALGAGHISRCLTLAESLKARGASITFVSAVGSLSVVPRLAEVADEVVEIPGSVREEQGPVEEVWSAAEQEDDARLTVESLAGETIDLLVVDHYGLDYRWESAVRSLAQRILVIDDLANRQHDCDTLLDQNLRSDGRERYRGLVPNECKLLLGPRFALLRDEFAAAQHHRPVRTGEINRVLVSFGGVDGANATSVALDAIDEIGFGEGRGIDVVIGSLHPAREAIEDRCSDMGYLAHVQTDQIGKLMARADLAIGSPSASAWERCCLGLPTVTFATADNQREIAEALSDAGAIIHLGSMAPTTQHDLELALTRLTRDIELVAAMGVRSYAVMQDHRPIEEFFYDGDWQEV